MELRSSCGWPAKGIPLLSHPYSEMVGVGGEAPDPGFGNRSMVTRGWRQWLPSRPVFSPSGHEVGPSRPTGWILEDTMIPFKAFRESWFLPQIP